MYRTCRIADFGSGSVWITLAILAALAGQNWSDPSSEIRLPGNAATPISDAERGLEDLQDGIKRLVPEMVEANQARARAH